jgi:hypothetical protein
MPVTSLSGITDSGRVICGDLFCVDGGACWLVVILRSCLSSLHLLKLALRLCEFIGQLESPFEESKQLTLPVSVLSLSFLYPLKRYSLQGCCSLLFGELSERRLCLTGELA